MKWEKLMLHSQVCLIMFSLSLPLFRLQGWGEGPRCCLEPSLSFLLRKKASPCHPGPGLGLLARPCCSPHEYNSCTACQHQSRPPRDQDAARQKQDLHVVISEHWKIQVSYKPQKWPIMPFSWQIGKTASSLLIIALVLLLSALLPDKICESLQ